MEHPIHKVPYTIPFLPYVAPHGGKDAYGWVVDHRLVAYYHPGDIGDAWADGHAGIKPELAEVCYQLGTNVIFYAHAEYNKSLDPSQESTAVPLKSYKPHTPGPAKKVGPAPVKADPGTPSKSSPFNSSKDNLLDDLLDNPR